jgi:hypothetical protein
MHLFFQLPKKVVHLWHFPDYKERVTLVMVPSRALLHHRLMVHFEPTYINVHAYASPRAGAVR